MLFHALTTLVGAPVVAGFSYYVVPIEAGDWLAFCKGSSLKTVYYDDVPHALCGCV